MTHLQARLAEYDGKFDQLENLEPEHLRFIGTYIQMYNFIEFNCRRCIEVFALAGLLSGRAGRKPQRTPVSELIATIKNVTGKMDPAVEDISDTLAKLDEIEQRRGFRNIFAHWVARKIPREDAIALFSMDGFDQKQISGIDAPLEDVPQTVIFDLADMRGLLSHMSIYEKWIAAKTSEWYARLLPGR